MKVRIWTDAANRYMNSLGLAQRSYGTTDAERSRVYGLRAIEGTTQEVATKYLFDNQFALVSSAVRVMEADVAEVIDDERLTRQVCEACGPNNRQFYVLADEKVPYDHCRHCYNGRPDVLTICRVDARKGQAIEWTECKYRVEGKEPEYIYATADTRLTPLIIEANVDGERLTFRRIPSWTLRGVVTQEARDFHLIAVDSKGQEWAVMFSERYPAHHFHYFGMSAKY